MNPKSLLRLPDFDAEGFVFELSTELEVPENPPVFLKIQNKDRTCAFELVLSREGMDYVSELLFASSRDIEEAYEQYWEKQEKEKKYK